MGVVSFVFGTIGKCIDILCFMLDLNFCIVNSLVQLLLCLIAFVNNLPTLLLESAVDCWNLTLFCMLTATEGISTAAQGALGGCLQLLGGMSESFKMMGHLSSHVMLRTKEQLHRGLLSGHYLLRQVWEGCSISVSLALYLINTIINVMLIALQNCYGVLVGAWEAVSGPIQKALELGVALLTFLYSTLVGTSILLWTPCQLALESLGSLCHAFASVFLLNSYGLALTATIAATATLYLNTELPRRAMPALHRLQRVLRRLYLLALERAQAVLEADLWERVGWQRSWIGLRRGRGGNGMGGGREATQPAASVEQGSLGGGVAAEGRQQEEVAPPLSAIQPGTSHEGAPWGDGKPAPPEDSLLSLLKEHEDRKKCVICQDSSKTVVLLPCRHLCLCRDCTSILMRQPIYQHNCPLCRHMILQTMDVYL